MTSRERLVSAAHGEPTDRKPVIDWPSLQNGDLDQNSAAIVLNPLGRAIQQVLPLVETLASEPDSAETVLDSLVEQAKNELSRATKSGAIAIYLLYGATPRHTTPMEYGGHFLERDREILASEPEAFKMILVVGDDAYLDFVSDLPADIFAWDSKATGVSVAEMRQMRQGALATNDPDADIDLRFGVENVSEWLENQLKERHAAAV